MQRSALSARAAGAYLGFASANPILDAIRSGELAAERRPGVSRNGRNRHSYLIQTAELDRWAAAHGLEKPTPAESEAPDPAEEYGPIMPPEPSADEREPETFNVRRIVPWPPQARPETGVVSIPIEHYAELVAARAERDFMKAHFVFTWRGGSAPDAAALARGGWQFAEKVQFRAPEFGVESGELPNPPARQTRAPRRARASK